MDPVKNGRIGVILMAYSVATNVLSAFTGIVMGVIVQPGQYCASIFILIIHLLKGEAADLISSLISSLI